MGSTVGRSDERPTTDTCFDTPFWIDRFEVSNSAFGTVGLLSGDEKPRVSVGLMRLHIAQSAGHVCPQRQSGNTQHAAPIGLTYPWGPDFDGLLLNFCDVNCRESWADANSDDGFRTMAFVGSYPAGASWVGAEDMAGNVWNGLMRSIAAIPTIQRMDERSAPVKTGSI